MGDVEAVMPLASEKDGHYCRRMRKVLKEDMGITSRLARQELCRLLTESNCGNRRLQVDHHPERPSWRKWVRSDIQFSDWELERAALPPREQFDSEIIEAQRRVRE